MESTNFKIKSTKYSINGIDVIVTREMEETQHTIINNIINLFSKIKDEEKIR